MKKYIMYTMILFSSGLFAQGIYNNGAKIAVGAGSYLTIGGTNGNYRNETNVNSGSIDLAGTLSVTGNVTNNASGADILGVVTTSSSVVLNGTTSQTLGGTSIMPFMLPNLTVNNLSGIVLSNNAQVNGNMTFSSGLVSIGNTNFTFGPSAIVAGIPSATSMIVATGTGQVQKVWLAKGAFTFPIGDNNLTAKYSPVSLSFTSGTFAAGSITGMNVVNAKYNDPSITGSYLNRYWNLTQTGITAFACDAVFQYLSTDVNLTGTESSINNIKVIPSPFTIYNPASSALHQLSATGLSSFGTFTGATGDKMLTLSSVMLQGVYNGASTMRQALNAIGPNWPAGVADHITVELHSAIAGSYAPVIYSAIDIPLSTTGTATVAIPGNFNGSYYITIKHRNSIETTTVSPISFAANSVNQSYGVMANVFGGNLGLSIDNNYLIYTGDVNQDGKIDSRDFTGVDNDSKIIAKGYVITDVDGNGKVDTRDFTPIDNNNKTLIKTSHP